MRAEIIHLNMKNAEHLYKRIYRQEFR